MNIQDIEKIPFREKRKLVNHLFMMHEKIEILRKGIKPQFRRRVIPESNEKSTFQFILERLKPEHSLIITSEFGKKISGKKPAEYCWSKTTYYKYMHNAYNEFLFYFYA